MSYFDRAGSTQTPRSGRRDKCFINEGVVEQRVVSEIGSTRARRKALTVMAHAGVSLPALVGFSG